MTVERLFVSRWGMAASLLCLLALVTVGSWFYQAEATSAEEKASQQLALLAQTEARLIAEGRQRLVAIGNYLLQDSLFTASAVSLLEQRREEEMVRWRLHLIMEQEGFAGVLIMTSSGTIQYRLGQVGEISSQFSRTIAQAATNFHPEIILSPPEKTENHVMVGVVVPIHQDRTRGAVVLLADASRLFLPLVEAGQGIQKGPRPCLVQVNAQGMLLVQTENQQSTLQWQAANEQPADSLVGMAAADQSGLVRGRDKQGELSLGYIVRLPENGEWLVVSEPVSRIFSLWRYRAAVLLFFFAGAVGLVSVLWQCSRKAYYKTLYATEATLRRTLEYQAIVLQTIGDGVIATGRTGLIELINPAAEQLTGWKKDEALGRPLGDVFVAVNGSTAPRQPSASDNSRRSGSSLGSHHLLLARDGQERAITVLSVPLSNGQGEVAGTVLTFQDRSEEEQDRQWTESRLLLREYAYTHGARELLYRAVQELALLLESPKGFCASLQTPPITVAVQRRSEPGTSHCWSWYDGEGEPICEGLEQWLPDLPIEACLQDPSIVDKDEKTTPICRFGSKREILLPVQRAGRRVALLAVADKPRPYLSRDRANMVQMGEYIWRLMEQKQMEEELLASERRYRTLYQSMMDAFVVTDLQGKIRECNQAYAAMLGFTAEEIKGRFASDFTPERWQIYEQEYVRQQLLYSGYSALYEKEYRHREGTLIPVELKTFLLVDNEGQPEGMSAVVRDISARKHSELEREKLRHRLNQAQRLESVGQLAGGVAHDFNNMLSVIIGYAELALRQLELTEPLEQYLREIVKAGRRSADVTRQLLAFARRQNITPKVLDLNATLESMLNMLRRLIGEDIELIWLPGKDIWPIRMDPSQVDQLLANLCVNARDAICNVGKITIETNTMSFDEAYCREREGFIPGNYVVLMVSDNGRGIERNILDKIFEPFFTTKAFGQGTGLGLATVYGIVKQNNGFINVYSEPGHGTTFRIYLPRQEGKVEIIQPEDNQPLPIGNREIILVVEDEASMLTLNRTMIEQLNYTVLTAITPREALQLARVHGQAIRLLITDVIMPEMNGRDLARAVTEYCPKAKTLFMSGYTANVIAHRGELEPEVHFIAKPFSTEELAYAIRNALLDNHNHCLKKLHN